MDNSFDQNNSKTRLKTELLGSLLQIYYNIKSWLVASFVLTEEERIDAGIYIGRLRNDE